VPLVVGDSVAGLDVVDRWLGLDAELGDELLGSVLCAIASVADARVNNPTHSEVVYVRIWILLRPLTVAPAWRARCVGGIGYRLATSWDRAYKPSLVGRPCKLSLLLFCGIGHPPVACLALSLSLKVATRPLAGYHRDHLLTCRGQR
jgi:hypothetical protein